MSATFACPHCAATYPVKPVLVGRVVRCTKCRNAFILQSDGHAEKVAGAETEATSTVPQPPAKTAATVPAPLEPSRPPAAVPRPAPTKPAAAPVPSAAEPAEPPKPRRASTEGTGTVQKAEARARLNEQQEEARRSMAGTLANAALAALQAEKAQQEAAAQKGGTARSKRLASTTAKKDSARHSPVLVVGVGEAEAKAMRTFKIYAALGVVALILLVGACLYRSAPRKALDDFAAPVGSKYARYPQRLPHMQSRSWMSDCNVLADLGTVHIGTARSLKLDAVKPLVSDIKDLTYLPNLELWVVSADANKAQKAWSAKQNRDANLQTLKQKGIEAVSRSDLQARLQAAGLPEEDSTILMNLLLPANSTPQDDAARISKGELPDAIEVIPFHGSGGQALRDSGNKYIYPSTNYTGLLMRFIGAGWSDALRVYSVTFDNQQ